MESNVWGADWWAGELEGYFENLRTALDGVRHWGQQWKDLAKNLIEEYEPELLEEE